jgi:hypothetical protein
MAGWQACCIWEGWDVLVKKSFHASNKNGIIALLFAPASFGMCHGSCQKSWDLNLSCSNSSSLTCSCYLYSPWGNGPYLQGNLLYIHVTALPCPYCFCGVSQIILKFLVLFSWQSNLFNKGFWRSIIMFWSLVSQNPVQNPVQVEALGTGSGKPSKKVVIADSGELLL